MPEEPAIKLRPRKPRFVRDESKSWSSAFKGLMRIARMTSSRKPSSGANTAARPRKAHKQRCAIRVTYSPNQVRGQWAAHGRYIARESANSEGVGFTAEKENVAIAAELGDWQKAGDPRMFKMIVSPEFGERLDLKRHTRDLMKRLGSELNVPLEWVAVAHFNTGHPHVHIALRGLTALGNLRIPRDVIKHSIRNHAEDLCTEQLGFRTVGDAIESGRREISALNVTSLDRELARKMSPTSAEWGSIQTPEPSGSELQRIKASQLQARLGVLAKLDLAQSNPNGHWNLRTDFHQKLRALQTANDRQRSQAINVTTTLDRKSAEKARPR
jgi:type IV secretory pathway VirD2 relaxase